MAKFSFHCQSFKKQQLIGIDRHNRRINKHYSNTDIDVSRCKDNRIYITPDTSLYQMCKKQIEERVLAHDGRVTKSSNWICECIFSYPEELPADRMDEYYGLIIEYIADKLGKENILQAIVHCDEGGLPHMHMDVVPITQDYRLSSKAMITREFITNVHDELPCILRANGFAVERGSDEHETAGLSAKEYKRQMDKEASEFDNHINVLSEEYNQLVDAYNELLRIKELLERNNLRKAQEVLNHRQISR